MKIIKYILVFIVFIPIFINASCNYDKLNEHAKLSNDIDYELEYSKSNKQFNVKIINLYNGLFINYNNKIYTGNSNNEATIRGINEGTNMIFNINSNLDECDSFIRSFNINLEYYNEYYDSYLCEKYKDKLTVCSRQFLPYKINQTLFNDAVKNYENSYIEEEIKEENDAEKINVYDNIQNFFNEWGLLIILVILSSLITSAIFRNIFRKVKHGL